MTTTEKVQVNLGEIIADRGEREREGSSLDLHDSPLLYRGLEIIIRLSPSITKSCNCLLCITLFIDVNITYVLGG